MKKALNHKKNQSKTKIEKKKNAPQKIKTKNSSLFSLYFSIIFLSLARLGCPDPRAGLACPLRQRRDAEARGASLAVAPGGPGDVDVGPLDALGGREERRKRVEGGG